jgi:hypothetical protein
MEFCLSGQESEQQAEALAETTRNLNQDRFPPGTTFLNSLAHRLVRLDLFVTEGIKAKTASFARSCSGVGAWAPLATSQAAATPSLSLRSRTIRSAVFLPSPLIFESDATLEFTTALLK